MKLLGTNKKDSKTETETQTKKKKTNRDRQATNEIKKIDQEKGEEKLKRKTD